jgi:hypothetical protein
MYIWIFIFNTDYSDFCRSKLAVLNISWNYRFQHILLVDTNWKRIKRKINFYCAFCRSLKGHRDEESTFSSFWKVEKVLPEEAFSPVFNKQDNFCCSNIFSPVKNGNFIFPYISPNIINCTCKAQFSFASCIQHSMDAFKGWENIVQKLQPVECKSTNNYKSCRLKVKFV